MSGREVTSDPAEVFAKLTAEGLTVPSGVPIENIVPSMALIGVWGATVEGGLVYGDGAYTVTPGDMVAALAAGMRPFMFVYTRSDGGHHAVTAIGLDDQTVALVDPAGGPVVPAPISEVLRLGVASYAYTSHREDITPSALGGYLPPGVESDAFGDWREASKIARTDYTDSQAFLDHLAALGADWTDPHKYGYPRWTPAPPAAPAPPDAPTDLRILQVWQNFDAAQVAAFCANAGLNAVMVKALDGTFWMGDRYAGNPASPAAVAAQRAFFHSLGIRYGVWSNPLYGDDAFLQAQAAETAAAALQADFLALDTEPYGEHFWGANRPAGAAETFMQRVREGAPEATLYWQPDPRPARLAELRPGEWAPYMNGWMGQHYWPDFGTTPEEEVANAANQHARWTPAGKLLPTFSLSDATPGEMERAGRAAQGVGADGFVLWRHDLANDFALSRAAVQGWSA
jgi:hypothetical protein